MFEILCQPIPLSCSACPRGRLLRAILGLESVGHYGSTPLTREGHMLKALHQRRRINTFVKKAENQPPGKYPYTTRDIDFAHALLEDLNDAINK